MYVDRLRTLFVEDVMSRKVIELAPQQPLREAAHQFTTQGISSAPVVDDQQKCVGMLSAVDFIKPMADTRTKESAAGAAGTVGHYMTRQIAAVSSKQTLRTAAEVMSSTHVHHLPVIDQGRVVGIVSTMDIVAALLNILDESDRAP
jgi:predicted transcriptional regulator